MQRTLHTFYKVNIQCLYLLKLILSNLKDGVHLNLNKTSVAKWQSKGYQLIPLLTHLSFCRTIPLTNGMVWEQYLERYCIWAIGDKRS
jgi:hypothetical protein